jgi:hypothetical protein
MHRSMSRHVAYVEAYGVPTPESRQRQREIISAASAQYRPLPDASPGSDPSLIAGFAFSTRTSAPDALARLVGILDAVDPDWRGYVRVWDGWERMDDSQPQLADPPFAASAAQGPRPRLRLLDRLRALIRR